MKKKKKNRLLHAEDVESLSLDYGTTELEVNGQSWCSDERRVSQRKLLAEEIVSGHFAALQWQSNGVSSERGSLKTVVIIVGYLIFIRQLQKITLIPIPNEIFNSPCSCSLLLQQPASPCSCSVRVTYHYIWPILTSSVASTI